MATPVCDGELDYFQPVDRTGIFPCQSGGKKLCEIGVDQTGR